MRLKHRRLICIITSFIMAVTVFSCTSLTFATEGEGDDSVVDNTQSTTVVTPAENDTPATTEGTEENGEDPEEPQIVDIDAPTLTATTAGMDITLKWTLPEPKNGGTISYELSCDDPSVALDPEEGQTELTVTVSEYNTYRFTIKAVEKKDGAEVSVSEIVSVDVTIAEFSEQMLTGLRSDPGYRAVLLEWNKVEGATGYLIYRRQGGERGNTDANCLDSDNHKLITFKSSKSKGYGTVKKPGAFTLVKDLQGNSADDRGKINYRDGGLADLNMTYVYFYQYVIVPYYKESDTSEPVFCRSETERLITDTTPDTIGFYGTNRGYNTVKNNTVLPMYILYKVKKTKPYYKTNSMKDGKKMGKLSKGTLYVGFDKKDGRDRFYMKKSGTSRTEWWFAQKNANVVQGYYLNNGNAQDLNRKDWATGYSKKTVLDFVNHSGLSSSNGKLIWVSKYAQHAYIFTGSKGHWKLVNNGANGITTGSKGYWSNLCASGKVLFNSRNNNGPINGKQYVAKRKKYYYYNLSKLHSTERLHSVLYKKKAAFGSGKYYDKTLGSPKSNGCIRLKPGASQFIYKWAPKGTKVYVY